MTVTLGELARLAEPVRAAGLRAPVFARYTADPQADLAIQLEAVGPDLVLAVDEPAAADGTTVTWIRVTGAPQAGWRLVLVRAAGAAGEAALRVGAQLAVARDAELVVDAGSRPGRRVVAAVRELAASGMRARIGAVPVDTGPADVQFGDTGPGDREPLVVATEGSAHLLVRSPRTDVQDEPREWIRQMVAPAAAPAQGIGGVGPV